MKVYQLCSVYPSAIGWGKEYKNLVLLARSYLQLNVRSWVVIGVSFFTLLVNRFQEKKGCTRNGTPFSIVLEIFFCMPFLQQEVQMKPKKLFLRVLHML